MRYKLTALYLSGLMLSVLGYGETASAKPKLVINIVVSQMRYEYLERFRNNFGEKGFRTFMTEGVDFRNAYYNYMNTNTLSGLATLSTGTDPCGHGIVSSQWFNYTTNDTVNLISNHEVKGLDSEEGENAYSPLYLTAATLGDRLHESDPQSKVVSLATDPYSAIVSGGSTGLAYWYDSGRGKWVSSSYYFTALPLWVKKYNEKNFPLLLADRNWVPEKPLSAYHNSDTTVLNFATNPTGFKGFLQKIVRLFKKKEDPKQELPTLIYTPCGNTLVSDFVRETIAQEQLGKDDHTDLLTVCYDTPRLLGEHFGPQSIEVEDMYYKLDQELGDLVEYVRSQYKPEEVVMVLTSDHGCSNTYKPESRVPGGLFNADQFKMIINGFLSAQYEPGNWVLGYNNRQLYLDRSMIYKYGFDLSEVQNRVASFALQFRGVCGALTSTSLQGGSFAKGIGEKMQNSFYPKRCGDVLLNLMPGWIEERPDVVSLSGSMYEYDTHVPLLFLGGGLTERTVQRTVDMSSLATTLARMMQIPQPDAATGTVFEEALPQ